MEMAIVKTNDHAAAGYSIESNVLKCDCSYILSLLLTVVSCPLPKTNYCIV
jgi:hypothetical protein